MERKYEEFVFKPTHSDAERERIRKELAERGPVPTWSFSTLQNFEDCPYRVKLQKIDKLDRGATPAADRGNQIHDHCERYIKGETDKVTVRNDRKVQLDYHEPVLTELRELYQDGIVEVEQNWGFREDWSKTGFFDEDVWARMKLDVCVHESGQSIRIIDWKTGRKQGNEVKHGSQGICYAVGAAKRYPRAELITTEFHYLDHKEPPLKKSFNPQRIEILAPRLEERARQLTEAQFFPPKPGRMKCRMCDYKTECEYSMA